MARGLILTSIFTSLLLVACCHGDTRVPFAEKTAIRDVIDMWNPPVRLTTTKPSINNVSQACLQDLLQLLAPNSPLILALDSFGKPTPGLLVGNVAWLGHFDECMNITDFRYCLVDLGLNVSIGNNSLALPVQWGVCVPETCSEADVENSVELLLQYLNITWLTVKDLYGSAAHCANKPNTNFNGGFIGTCVLISVLFLLSVAGTIADKYLAYKAASSTLPSFQPNGLDEGHEKGHSSNVGYGKYTSLDADKAEARNSIHHSELCSENSPLLLKAGKPQTTPNTTSKTKKQELSVWLRFLLCFALSRNLPKILSAKQAEGGIPCLNGIRVISISWVILGHSISMVLNAGLSENLFNAGLEFINRFSFQAIIGANFAVDTFFFLSGFLLTFWTMKRMKEKGGKMEWGWLYLHRYIRLTPALGMLILIWMFIFPNMSQGPVWYKTETKLNICHYYWWTDLLYINNFIPPGLRDDCIAWGWYLANDMQFFVLSPLLLIPLYWYPKIGMTALGTTCVASFITNAVLVYQNGFSIGTLQTNGGQMQGGQATFPPEHTGPGYLPANDYSSIIYIKPYCRIPPYLVGMALGYAMYRVGRKPVKLSLVVVAAGWAIASGLAMAVVYGVYNANRAATVPTLAASMAYTSLSTFTWAVAVGWVVFACQYGYGGIINDFLSWNFWIPLSRLTYSTYLIHPVIQSLFGYSLAVPMHWSLITLSYNFVAFLTLAHVCALVMALLVEFPFGNMEKMLYNAVRKPTKER